jgi:signal transduction histidine kinase
MTVRLRCALLYSGAFLLTGLLVLSVAFLMVSSTQQVGSAGPVVVRHSFAQAFGPIPEVAASLAVLVVLSVAFGWLLASRLLRPVRAITAAARDISASNLSRGLRLGRRDDEFTRLGETLNDLFASPEASFQAQRHFVANASHELRTPLMAERTLLQVTLADPEANAATLRGACEQVLALGMRTERLIDALLTLATGSAASSDGSRATSPTSPPARSRPSVRRSRAVASSSRRSWTRRRPTATPGWWRA